MAASGAGGLWACLPLGRLGVPELLAVMSVLVLVVLLVSGRFAPMLPWLGP